jgi:hypothetical protein
VTAKKYQSSDLVKGRSFCFCGTEDIAITSLNEMITTTVMMPRTQTWPAASMPKKPRIMTSVHIVRVIKVCFFFSYSEAAVAGCSFDAAPFSSSFLGLPGSLEASVDELWRRASAPPLARC